MTQHVASPTRRSVLRAAAWTAPAVSIAVAAPAFATSPGSQPGGSAGQVGIIRAGTILKLSTTLTADTALTGVSAVVTLTFVNANDTHITSTSVSSPWRTSGHGAASATFSAATLRSGTTTFAPNINLDNVSFDSVRISITFTWTGNTQGVTTTATYSKDKSLP